MLGRLLSHFSRHFLLELNVVLNTSMAAQVVSLSHQLQVSDNYSDLAK